MTLSWPETRGATQFDVQVYDVITNERVYNVTVHVPDVLLTKVEPDMQYTFYVTGLGNENQRGNTISCTGSTGMHGLSLLSHTVYLVYEFVNLVLRCKRMYPVSQKPGHYRVLSVTLSLPNDFKRSCTGRFSCKFGIKLLLNIPPTP